MNKLSLVLLIALFSVSTIASKMNNLSPKNESDPGKSLFCNFSSHTSDNHQCLTSHKNTNILSNKNIKSGVLEAQNIPEDFQNTPMNDCSGTNKLYFESPQISDQEGCSELKRATSIEDYLSPIPAGSNGGNVESWNSPLEFYNRVPADQNVKFSFDSFSGHFSALQLQNLAEKENCSLVSGHILRENLSTVEKAKIFLQKYFIKDISVKNYNDLDFNDVLCSITFEEAVSSNLKATQHLTDLNLVLKIDSSKASIPCFKYFDDLIEAGLETETACCLKNVSDALFLNCLEGLVNNLKDADAVIITLMQHIFINRGSTMRLLASFGKLYYLNEDLLIDRVAKFLQLSPLSHLLEEALCFFSLSKLSDYIEFHEIFAPFVAENGSLRTLYLTVNLLSIYRSDTAWSEAYSFAMSDQCLQLFSSFLESFFGSLTHLQQHIPKNDERKLLGNFYTRCVATAANVQKSLKIPNTTHKIYPAMNELFRQIQSLFQILCSKKAVFSFFIDDLKATKISLMSANASTVLDHFKHVIYPLTACTNKRVGAIFGSIFQTLLISGKNSSFAVKFSDFQAILFDLLIATSFDGNSAQTLTILCCCFMLFNHHSIKNKDTILSNLKETFIEILCISNFFCSAVLTLPMQDSTLAARKKIAYRLLLECVRTDEAIKFLLDQNPDPSFGSLFSNFWIPDSNNGEFISYLSTFNQDDLVTFFIFFWNNTDVYAAGVFKEFLVLLNHYLFSHNSMFVNPDSTQTSHYLHALNTRFPQTAQFLKERSKNIHQMCSSIWDNNRKIPTQVALHLFQALNTTSITHSSQVFEQFEPYEVYRDFSF